MKKTEELRKNEKNTKKIEKKFGSKAEFYRLLDGEEVLGSIEDLPVSKRGTLGRAFATLTNRRFIVESEIVENAKGDDKRYHQGRDVFYYETELNKIESVKYFSSDNVSAKGSIIVFIILLLLGVGVALLNFFLVMGKTDDGFSKYALFGVAALLIIFALPFIKRKSGARNLQLVIYSQTSQIEFSDDPNADLTLVVTNEVADKMSLLVKGIRQAQASVRK